MVRSGASKLAICGLVTLLAAPALRAAEPAPPAMSKQEIDAFLARPLVARLATVRANGTPQITPMWFLWENGVLYMSTRVKAAKVKHIRAHPRVAVVIDVMEAPFENESVTIEGPAEIRTTGVKEVVTKIYRKYLGAEGLKSERARKGIETPRVILAITPVKVWSVDTTHPAPPQH